MSGNTSSKYAVSGAILPLRRCVLGAPRRRSCAQGAGMLRRGPREGPGRWTLHQAFRHRGGRAGTDEAGNAVREARGQRACFGTDVKSVNS